MTPREDVKSLVHTIRIAEEVRNYGRARIARRLLRIVYRNRHRGVSWIQ